MTRAYKAFISYSWADKEWGLWLHRALETYRAPKGVADGRTLHPIFKDREEQAAGGSISGAIEAALAASEYLVVICSPRSAKSQWVGREIAWFKTHKDKARILALIVEGEPGHATDECFPKALTHKVGPDLQVTDELEDAPLAADARPEGDGKRGAKLKLAAALLGVPLDTLVRRDDRRRAVRRRLVTSAAFGLAAVLGALSIFAFNQRDAAVVARNEAVKARDDAEGLIELILTDLKSDLEGYGTLKSVTQIGNRAIGYYEGQDVKALSPDQLGRRARVLLMLGEADNKRGDLNAALARYETAAATTGEQLARDPENPQRMFDHAQSVFWVGYIAWQRGDRAAAKRQFAEYHDLAQKLVASDPANEDWQAELDYAYSNLGTLAMDDGDAVAAEGWFRKSLEIALGRLEKAPDDADTIWAAGQAYAWLADAHYFQGKVGDARRTRELEVSLYEVALSKGFDSASIQDVIFSAKNALALAAVAANDIGEALRHSTDAAQSATKTLAIDPLNTKRADRASGALTTLAEVNLVAGNLDHARQQIIDATAIIESFDDVDMSTARWRKGASAKARLALAELELLEGKPQIAIDLFAAVERDLSPIKNANALDASMHQRLAAALAGRARLEPEPRELWREIVTVLGPTKDRIGPEALTVLMEAYLRSGETAEATRIRTRLYEAGYRHPDFLAVVEQFP